MKLADIQFLYQYSAWANGRILETATQLSTSQLLAQPLSTSPSIRDILVHTMSAQQIWLSRWQGISLSSLADPSEFATVADIRTHWDQVEADTQSYIASLTDERIQQPLSYQNLSGASFSEPLWQQMTHQVNHATQHRSEAAMLLTEFGASPGEVDVARFMRL